MVGPPPPPAAGVGVAGPAAGGAGAGCGGGAVKLKFCRYYAKDKTCFYGEECQFLHEEPGVAPAGPGPAASLGGLPLGIPPAAAAAAGPGYPPHGASPGPAAAAVVGPKKAELGAGGGGGGGGGGLDGPRLASECGGAARGWGGAGALAGGGGRRRRRGGEGEGGRRVVPAPRHAVVLPETNNNSHGGGGGPRAALPASPPYPRVRPALGAAVVPGGRDGGCAGSPEARPGRGETRPVLMVSERAGVCGKGLPPVGFGGQPGSCPSVWVRWTSLPRGPAGEEDGRKEAVLSRVLPLDGLLQTTYAEFQLSEVLSVPAEILH